MGSENLPIFKAAMSLAVYIEQIVKGFTKYHKYTMGQDLRLKSKALIFLVSHANNSRDKEEVYAKNILHTEEHRTNSSPTNTGEYDDEEKRNPACR